MSNERGPYTPQDDEPLTFDARGSDGGADSPRSGVLVVSIVVLIVLLIAFAIFAFSRLNGGVAEPEPYDVIKIDPDAGEPVPDDLEIAQADPVDPNEEPVFTEPPEEPALRTEPIDTPEPATVPAPAPPPQPAAQPKAAPQPQPTPPAPSAAAPARVQIGAFIDRNQAEQAWNDVALSFPAGMAGKTRTVEPVDVNGETRYRALIGGFASRADAEALCARLQGQGRDCFVRE